MPSTWRRSPTFRWRGPASCSPIARPRWTSPTAPAPRRAGAPTAAGVDGRVGRVGSPPADRKIVLDLTDGARAWLGRVGYDPVYGARPLKRAVQKYLQDPLDDAIPRGGSAGGLG